MNKIDNKNTYHLSRISLLGAMMVLFFIVQVDSAYGFKFTQTKPSPQVLAYASEMSQGGLLAGTNAARAANGLPPLGLNGQLNNSAQVKAQHMADNDYWAHVAPDGTQPWYFFQQSGYSYIRAGENLAYGFLTSQSVVNGWMASASHRANILGDYVDVGFGFVNTPNYQNSGNQTIVVAHYGTPPGYSPPALTPPPPPPTSTVSPNNPTPKPAAPTEAPMPVQTPANESPNSEQQDQPKSEQKNSEETTKQDAAPRKTLDVKTGEDKKITLATMIAEKKAPIMGLVALSSSSIIAAGYALTHRRAFQHAIANGDHFMMHHPAIDTVIVTALVALILLTSYGRVG